MRILSFDQSTNLTGYCCMDDGKYVESGVIDKHRIKDTNTRISDMGLSICKIIKKYNPDLVVLEDVQNQSNVKTVVYLARLQGGILLYNASKNIRTAILHPTEWRKVLQYKQGNKVERGALKQQSLEYVKEHFGLDKPEDETEAICICQASNILYNA